ncbi:MAG: hypothetical protein A3J48_00095 [Candidatus Doudnabacteria bacterium RIFCSPHIGHO2_02_FULL_46_11]|uniref:Uncharacterized protein n=1 Tax=Candidatus Doudnabacteria bacterium RIFCSPHIGHO2_02_FULL_46_11 TaxID=1817832 RepID=A0A1F5P984_9BACT|nr:MAG: hypothetical protein A3J48_00095 [Candidatus Doudnabacteria bacterium RIFCSPHIGHO2_02_FULL_46_11]
MIIIINGSRFAGKTTTSNLLAKKLKRTAHIELDALRWFLPGLNLEQTIPINLENAVLITKNLVSKKFNVIIDYCLRKRDHSYLIRNLKNPKTEIYTITLKPQIKAALTNRGRTLSKDDEKRIHEQYGKGKHAIREIGLVIDNTDKSPAEVAELIKNYVRKN